MAEHGDQLARLLQDPDWRICKEALVCLSKLEPAAMAEHLDQPDREVRRQALRC